MGSGDWQAEGFAEYGLRDRLTLTLGAEPLRSGRRLDLALRWHPPDLPMGMASGLTLGLRHVPDAPVRYRAMLGFDLGRGFQIGAGNLWLRAGARLLPGRDPAGWQTDLDLSSQIGLRRDGWIAMFGATRYQSDLGTRTRLRPAVGYEFDPRLTLVGEAVLAGNGRREGLRLSVWSRF